MTPAVLIRLARPSDAEEIVALVEALAAYENALEEVAMDVEDLERALFSPNPHVFCHVAEVNGALVALALWFLNFSTWTGTSGLYLEDLYVKDEYRGRGIGTLLMRSLAKICVDKGYSRFEWSVLNWNQPSIEFYLSIGSTPQDEWTRYRLADDNLRAYATPTITPISASDCR